SSSRPVRPKSIRQANMTYILVSHLAIISLLYWFCITPQLSRERPRSGLTSAGAQCYAQPIPLNVGLESCISVPPHDYVPGRPTPNDWLTGCSVIASPRDQNMSTRKLFEIIYTEHLQK